MMPAVPPNSSITTAMLLLCLMKFCNSSCNGMVSGTKFTAMSTSPMDAGWRKRHFELTYPTMLSMLPSQTKMREYMVSTNRCVSRAIEVFDSTASMSTLGTMQSRTRRSAKSSAF